MSLGNLLREAKERHNASLSDLTVLSPQNDPFRLDTAANHAKGRWFRDNLLACGVLSSGRTIHNRGAHYAIVSLGNAAMPSGEAYVNNIECWDFLEEASNAARWLGYVPWEAIVDARNAEPVIRIHEAERPGYTVALDASTFLPDSDDLKLQVRAVGFAPRQQHRIVFYGEKTSLNDVLGTLADEYGADLYLPSGEISNTLLAQMARTGAEDGREMVVFIFADCDPSGYQMATSIGHKLRAFQDGHYPDLRFRVLTPALTVEQVKTLGLPSTPLKDTERRAGGWRDRYGVDQTEIDALATLRPDVLRAIVREAVDPYFDHSLDRRARQARSAWEAAALAALERQVGVDRIVDIQTRAATNLEALREDLSELTAATEGVDLDLPDMAIPAPAIGHPAVQPLVSSDMSLFEHINTLRERKNYG